jgi:two-component system, OmpR family, sensor histidine kinase MtrB
MNRSLNALLAWMTVGVASVGFLALTALAVITSALHVVSRDLSTAIESVRVSEEIELQLFVHQESQSPVNKGAAVAQLRHSIDEAERLIQSNNERRVVAELRKALDAYLRSDNGATEAASAFALARRLSMLNVEQSQEAQERAERWNRLSNIGGSVAGVLLFAGVTGFLIWLRRGPFRRIAALSDAMDRFSKGDLDARAPEMGTREVSAMAHTFNATARGLVQARQRQSQYVATVIHDLRAPLAVVQLATGYVSPDRPMPPEQRIRGLFELIGRQLTRLNGLIGDVLNATYIEQGEMTLLRSDFDLRPLVTASVHLFRELAPEHRFELTMPSQPLDLQGDRARLEQVINNLLSNAVKYSPLGSRVRVQLARAGDDLTLEVSDEGPGIAPEEREHIFETFQRRSATFEEAPGTSLGLWVSRRVVEAHGGRLELDSHVGKGSTFRVFLPAAPQQVAPTGAAQEGLA